VADIERAIVAFAREPNGGLILPPDTVTFKREFEPTELHAAPLLRHLT
jgi:hypothetical protein